MSILLERSPIKSSIRPSLPAEALVILAGVLAVAAQVHLSRQGSPPVALLLFLLASLIFVGALGRQPLAPTRPVPRLGEATGFALICAVAVFFRGYQLTTAPEGAWFDEAQNALVAQRISSDPAYRPVFVPDLTQLPALFFYFVAVSIKILGANILAVRLVSTLFGLGAVIGLYFLSRLLFGVPIALMAGLLFASQRWHVNFSRFGMNGILVPAFELGALYFTLRGLRAGRRLDFAIAGGFVGLGLNSYPAFSVVLAILAIVILATAARQPRRFLRRNWAGLAIFIAAAGIVVAPLAHFAVENPQAFAQRTETVSVLRGSKTPEQAVGAVLENLRKHAIMFNFRGDANGRHNLPGAPMVDTVSSALLVLGLAYSLRQIRRPEHALLVSWLVLGIMPGVFSLDFEAPQAYRSIAVTPVVALLGALGLGWLAGRAWEMRRRVTRLAATLPALTALVFALGSNYHTYFQQQLVDPSAWAAYSTAETLVARELAKLPAEMRIFFSGTYAGHPTIKFLVPRLHDHPVFDPTAQLPIQGDQATALFLDPHIERGLDLIRKFYPKVQVVEHRGPRGGPNIMTMVIIDSDQARSLQGIQASYFAGPESDFQGQPVLTRQEETVDTHWAEPPLLAFPLSASWKGTLSVPSYGKYRFRLEGPIEGILYIDETEVTRGGQDSAPLELARGNHSLRVQSPVPAPGSVRLLWQTPERSEWQRLGRHVLFVEPVTNNGLLGGYFSNSEWRGAPAFTRIDPLLSFRFHIRPLPPPYSIEWRGKIAIPSGGTYRFATQSIDASWLYIDGDLVVDNSRNRDQLVEEAVSLTAGYHDIRVRYLDQTNFTHLEVYWTPPGRAREIIPTERLFPPQGSYPASIAPLADGAAPSPAIPAPAPSRPDHASAVGQGATTQATVLVDASGSGEGALRDPRGVALDRAGNLYVADTGNRRVQKFDPNGRFLLAIGPGDGDTALVEPVAVTVDPAGTIFILDAQTASVGQYDAQGKLLGRIDTQKMDAYRPRGIDADAEGRLYLADTGRARILIVSPQGELVGQLGQKGQGEGQIQAPTDVTVDRSGTLFVADADNSKIVKLGPDGGYQGQWTVPQANSVYGPHLAPDQAGGVYATDPEAGKIRHYGARGELIEEIGPLEVAGRLMRRPIGLRWIAPDTLVVADTDNDRVLRVTIPR